MNGAKKRRKRTRTSEKARTNAKLLCLIFLYLTLLGIRMLKSVARSRSRMTAAKEE